MHNNLKELTLSNQLCPIEPQNIFHDDDYFHWCSSVLKGTDGKYHLCYSRWKRTFSFDGWLTHSTVAHAVSDYPSGPYHYVNTLLDFEKDQYGITDKITAHNPKIEYFKGRYYLYFCSTHTNHELSNQELAETAVTGPSHPNWKMLRENQRTFVAWSDSLNGPFTVSLQPLIEPSGPISTLAVNPAITQGHDGRYYLIVKGDKPGSVKFERNQAIAVSDFPDRGFLLQKNPVICEWDSEDMSLWYDNQTHYYYAVFHAHTFIGMMVSEDGIHWRKASDFTVMPKYIQQKSGKPILPSRLERPFVFVEDGIPRSLSVAVLQDNGDAYIVFIPLTDSY